jgi:hypothetical protein
MMGAQLVARVYRAWGHLPNRPFRLLLHIALTIKDHTPEPTYWGGREAMADALGLPPEEPLSHQSVKRTVRVLVEAGALERVLYGHAGARSEYRLHFPEWGSDSDPQKVIHRGSPTDPHRGSPRTPHRGSLSDEKGGQKLTNRGSLSDPPRNNKEQKQENEEEENSPKKVTLPSAKITAARSTPERLLAAVESIDQEADLDAAISGYRERRGTRTGEAS